MDGKIDAVSRIGAGLAGVFFAAAGLVAFLAPAAFFEAAAAFEPYNAHFLRDIGAFQVGLGAALLLAVWIRDGLVVALGGVGIGSLLHAIGHGLDRHLGGTPAIDIPFFGALSVLLLALAALRWRTIAQRRLS
ncbi:MAG: hypothetical protein WD080_06415 [Egibacteraceae bacterium]